MMDYGGGSTSTQVTQTASGTGRTLQGNRTAYSESGSLLVGDRANYTETGSVQLGQRATANTALFSGASIGNNSPITVNDSGGEQVATVAQNLSTTFAEAIRSMSPASTPASNAGTLTSTDSETDANAVTTWYKDWKVLAGIAAGLILLWLVRTLRSRG